MKSIKLCIEENCNKARKPTKRRCYMHITRRWRAGRKSRGQLSDKLEYTRTMNGFLNNYYYQNKRIYNFQFTKSQFMEYSLSSREFNRAFKLWKNSEFIDSLKPCMRTIAGPQWKLKNMYWDCRGGRRMNTKNKQAIYDLIGVTK